MRHAGRATCSLHRGIRPRFLGMAQRKTLTEAQARILRWIAEGCPDGVIVGQAHRISAAALRNRGLVKIVGRGATWAAEVTDVGREYLAELDGQDPPIARQANVSVTEQLVRDVVAAGGALRVPRRSWYPRVGVDYENRARLAVLHGRVPDGKRLSVTVWGVFIRSGRVQRRLPDVLAVLQPGQQGSNRGSVVASGAAVAGRATRPWASDRAACPGAGSGYVAATAGVGCAATRPDRPGTYRKKCPRPRQSPLIRVHRRR
jgi:hypothetical protein